MASDLNTGFHDVYDSAREIMKNKHRHLYINTLDLLTKTTRTTGTSAKTLQEGYVLFWYNDVLPLVFDDDKAIQDNAIIALETVLPYFEGIDMRTCPEWPSLKATIVEQYSKKLHDFRQSCNSNWYKIWAILIRILNKDILKGASIINTFLAIVELGFRCSDYGVRAEAFLCWKVLVEIFAKHDEIFSSKRIKLICIPLKSSHSKTLETAVNKFKVWWTFLCKISSRIDDYLEIYQSFLVFCFGPSIQGDPVPPNSTATGGQCRTYGKFKQMAIACMIASLGPGTKEVQTIMDSMGLESPVEPFVGKNLLLKSGLSVAKCCYDATILASESSAGSYGKQIELLWKYFGQKLEETKSSDLYLECFGEIRRVVENEQLTANADLRNYFTRIVDGMTSCKELPFDSGSQIGARKAFKNMIQVLEAIVKAKVPIALNTMQNLAEMFSLKKLAAESPEYWTIQKVVLPWLMTSSIEPDLGLAMWKSISDSLTDYLRRNLFEFRIKDNAKVVNDWIVWPLERNLAENCCDENLLTLWRNLMIAASSAEVAPVFTEELSTRLQSIFDRDIAKVTFPKVFGCFIKIMDNSFEAPSKPSTTFELIGTVLTSSRNPAKGSYNIIVESLTEYLLNLGKNQVIAAFPELKKICASIVDKETSNTFTKRVADDFKRTLQDKLKSNKPNEKKLLKEIKDLLKKDSTFVIIPTVWSLNPDKLTEHQREKMKEKRNDIPAMYNDISNSQDSSIKPWTPKKIVIAKSKNSHGEIVIENNAVDEEVAADVVTEVQTVANGNITIEKTPDLAVTKTAQPEFSKPADPPAISPQSQSSTGGDSSDLNESSTKNRKAPVRGSNNRRKLAKPKQKQLIGKNKRLIEKLNIKDAKNNSKVLRALKEMEIDTVQGNTVLPVRFRRRQSSVTSKLNDSKSTEMPGASDDQNQAKLKDSDDSIGGNSTENDSGKKTTTKRSRKSLAFKSYRKDDDDTADAVGEEQPPKETTQNNEDAVVATEVKTPEVNSSIDEIIEASQTVSQSILMKKVTARRSGFFNNTMIAPKPFENGQLKTPKKSSNDEPVLIPALDPTSADKTHNITTSPLFSDNNNVVEKSLEVANDQANMAEATTQPNSERVFDDLMRAKPIRPAAEVSVTAPEILTPPTIGLNTSMTSSNTSTATSLASTTPSVNGFLNVLAEINAAATPSISQQETQPNTEQSINTTQQDATVVDTSLNNAISEKSVTNDLNCSIRSSPELKDSEERNSEFLNNTLNISPIVNGEKDPCQRSIEQERTPTSPKKLSRNALHLPLLPDRTKSPITVESPVYQPKPSHQLTGRGAQLINLIRNKQQLIQHPGTPKLQHPGTPKLQPPPLFASPKPDEKSTVAANPGSSSNQEHSPPKKDQTPGATSTPTVPADRCATPIPLPNNYLVFSKVLPSPHASPSASILKRKLRRDSLDDIESPLSKRKRVSFHDPPVSLTKEYMKDSDENNVAIRPNSSRCILPDRSGSGSSTPNSVTKNNSLKRKSRVDSMLEIANFTPAAAQTSVNDLHSNRTIQFDRSSIIEMDSLKWNSTTVDSVHLDAVDENCLTPSPPSLSFANEEEMLKHVIEKYQFETLLGKYVDDEKALTSKTIRTVTEKISTLMNKDAVIKRTVLEALSEQHPREFLEHAIQENLSFTVCECLNFSSIVEFVCEKSKLNEDSRRTLLERIQALLSVEKLSDDAHQLMVALLKQHRMSDREIVDLMRIATDRRQEVEVNSDAS